MNFNYSETQRMVADAAKEFAEKYIRPHVMEWDESQEFPVEVFRKAGELGFMGVLVPEAYGGSGLDYHDYIAIVEEISKVDPSIGLSIAAHNSLCTNHILSFGNEQQKQRWLPKLASGEWIGAWGITEHNTGSDSGGMATTAVKDGENKTKTFTVVVCAENTEPSAQDFAASLAIPSFVSSDMPLPKTVDGYTDAAITWESADDSIIKIEDDGSGQKGSIVLDIVDRKVKLTATVSYRGNTGTKNFDVTVGHVEEINLNPYDKYQFTGTEFISTEWYEGKIDEGYKYRYADVKTDSAGIKSAVFTRIADYRNGKLRYRLVGGGNGCRNRR